MVLVAGLWALASGEEPSTLGTQTSYSEEISAEREERGRDVGLYSLRQVCVAVTSGRTAKHSRRNLIIFPHWLPPLDHF